MENKTIYHRMRALNKHMAANYKRGIGPTRVVLLLTTTGRKSGNPHTTPLQFEQIGEDFYIASALGVKSDWFCNILTNPHVTVRVKEREFSALAETVTDPECIADFLELRLKRHPLMIRLIMHLADRLPLRFDRADLVKLGGEKAMVILHPEKE